MCHWCGVVVTASDLVAGSSPDRFASRATLSKLFTHNVPLFTKQYKLEPAIGWEGNRMSGVALAMHHRLSGISTYGLNGLGKGDAIRSTTEYYLLSF